MSVSMITHITSMVYWFIFNLKTYILVEEFRKDWDESFAWYFSLSQSQTLQIKASLIRKDYNSKKNDFRSAEAVEFSNIQNSKQ